MSLKAAQYPIFQTLSGELSSSHYAELVAVSDDTVKSATGGISNKLFCVKIQAVSAGEERAGG